MLVTLLRVQAFKTGTVSLAVFAGIAKHTQAGSVCLLGLLLSQNLLRPHVDSSKVQCVHAGKVTN